MLLSVEFSARNVLEELERVLASPGFQRNERLSKFLRIVVERKLAGKADELKESVLGVEVFDRSPGYDSKRDPVVRTEAARLRARLGEYYAGQGKDALLVIELPKGGYVPELRETVGATAFIAPTQEASPKNSFSRFRTAIAVAFAGVVLCIAGWRWLAPKNAPIPIAVLPLKVLSEDAANDFFAVGLTGEIIRNLSLIEGLSVRSHTSSFAFKGKKGDVSEAGRQLGAEYILDGSVQRSGQSLRINAHLIRVRDGVTVWSNTFDRPVTDVFAIQDEISLGLVNSLRLSLGSGRRRYETSVEAYDLYLRARALIIWKGSYDSSIGPFEQAIAKDAAFAPAYAGLATAHAARSIQFRLNLADEMTKMRAAAQTSARLDPLLPEAHEALGMAYARDGQWEQSEKSFRRAIKLDGGNAASHDSFAMFFLLPLGRTEEALQQLRLAEKTDPLSPEVHCNLFWVLAALGRYSEAAAYCDKLPAQYPWKTNCVGRGLLAQGKPDEAIQLLEPAVRRATTTGSGVRGALGCGYARIGRRDEAEQLAADSALNPFNQAVTFACMGDKDRTFEALNRAAAAGPFRMGRELVVGREYDLIRKDPRLAALRKRVGLPE